MAGPQDDDAALARFRRGAGVRVGPPGPPPLPGDRRPATPQQARDAAAWAAAGGPGAEPISTGTVPGWAGEADPARPLFGDLVGPPPATSTAPPASPSSPLFDESPSEWLPVDDDPGRATGIASIVVGLFVGLVGLFLGVHSIRRSRAAGLAGGLGIAGVVISMLSIVIVGAIGLSWVRYEVQVAEQCSLVGPGLYVTSSGEQVTCR